MLAQIRLHFPPACMTVLTTPAAAGSKAFCAEQCRRFHTDPGGVVLFVLFYGILPLMSSSTPCPIR